MAVSAVHFCQHCRNPEAFAGSVPARVVCLTCGYQDVAPVSALFGRAEWDRRESPQQMLACLQELGRELTPRKSRLTVCAVVRSSYLPGDTSLREAVALAEAWADTGARPVGVLRLRHELGEWATRHRPDSWAAAAVICLSEDPIELRALEAPASRRLADSYRELFPNPFLPLAWNLDWFTSTVRDLAAHIYAAREFGAMPILADALQDAGCDDEQVLAHCRANAPHARGCWVLDAILGKA